MLQHAADAAALSGDAAGAVRLAQHALARPGVAEDPRRAAAIHERLRWFLWEAGEFEAADRALDFAERLVPAEPPSTMRARVIAQRAGMRLRQGRSGEALALAGEAIELARATGALGELAFALGVRGWARAAFGRSDDGAADIREALAVAEFLERPEGIALGLTSLASLLLLAGKHQETIEVAVGGLETLRSIGLERTYGPSLAATGAAAEYYLGRWDDARSRCRQALITTTRAPDDLWPAAVAMRLAAGSGDRELMDIARTAGEPLLRLATDVLHAAWFRLATVESLLTAGRVTSAQAEAQAAIDGLQPAVLDEPTAALFALAARVAGDQAESARAAGDDDAASRHRSIVDAAAAHLRRRVDAPDAAIPWPEATGAFVGLLAAEAGRASGRTDESQWDRAANRFDDLGLRYPAAYARARQAEAILDARAAGTRRPTREARSLAAAALALALETARDLGARPLEAACISLASRARLDVDGAHSASTEADRPPEDASDGLQLVSAFVARRGLTPREVDVLRLVASGWTNGEIASSLYITRKTASVHVSNILGKLAALDRLEAAAIAQRAGIVGPPRPGSTLSEPEPG